MLPNFRITAGYLRALACAGAVVLSALAARADVSFRIAGGEDEIEARVKAASLIVQASRDGTTGAQDLFAAARADYGRILGALYSEGRYSGVVSIRIDGREAAGIAPLDAPGTIGSIVVTVDPGPRFAFSAARMRPYAPGTALPPAYGDTRTARTTAIEEAAAAGVAGWRALGHAKARVAESRVIADHRARTVESLLLLDPGPRLRFGQLSLAGHERLRPARLRKMAGFPEGEIFDPEKAKTVSDRLRRSGVFRSVALAEADRPNPDGTLDFGLVVEEEVPRRFGLGAELQSQEGLALTGFWLHRNLFGGGERLRFDAGATGIGSPSGTDFRLGARIERPATPDADTTAHAEVRLERVEDPGYTSSEGALAFGFSRVWSEKLTGTLSLSFEGSRVRDVAGTRTYRQLALPLALTRDGRDNTGNPARGTYLSGEIRPFLGAGSSGSGVRLFIDARGYRGFGADDRFVLAGRVQAGTVAGPTLLETPRDYLFYSGGGGTVRGQPYQSLSAGPAAGGVTVGGQSFAGLSVEGRFLVSEKIGAVGFYDAGFVSAGEFFGGASEWHSGAGVGLRYMTAIGPIRLDVAVPVSGTTGDGLQLYLGIGQAF